MDIISTVFHYGEELFKFLVFGVGLGYIGRKVIADYMIKKGKLMINKSQRNSLVYHHTYNQELGNGHTAVLRFQGPAGPDPGAPLSRCAAPSGRGRHYDFGFTSSALMSSVIMNPLVPLNSYAFCPSGATRSV